jgi:hypothetical protein
VGGRVEGLMDEWEEVKAILLIAYSIQKMLYI